MSDTPRTDAKEKSSHGYPWSGYVPDDFARELEREMDNARYAIIANIKSNRQAAINSPQDATWSNGVAEGLEIALKFLTK